MDTHGRSSIMIDHDQGSGTLSFTPSRIRSPVLYLEQPHPRATKLPPGLGGDFRDTKALNKVPRH